MRKGILIVTMVVGLSVVGAGAASAQVSSQGGVPTPGAGDATKITADNREANASYNQRIGAADLKTSKADDRPKSHVSVKASLEDIKPGAVLHDIKGVQIGTIVSADANQAVVDTGQTKIGVPLIGFGKSDQGLLLNMTADKFKQLVAQAHSNAQAQTTQSN